MSLNFGKITRACQTYKIKPLQPKLEGKQDFYRVKKVNLIIFANLFFNDLIFNYFHMWKVDTFPPVA